MRKILPLVAAVLSRKKLQPHTQLLSSVSINKLYLVTSAKTEVQNTVPMAHPYATAVDHFFDLLTSVHTYKKDMKLIPLK